MIKQTQTKMFDFSDVGLDFCAGSKTKFPEVFKKMLVTGFNPQTVSSVATTGDQITLTFGVNHGYAADRVLLVTATGGFSKEVYIDSVTSNTITFTQAVTTGLSGTITTKVASLGWELVYELNHIHIYKFKHIDETDMYARLCFQNATATGNRNCIAVGIGRTVDLTAGHITDPNCMNDLATCTTVADASSNLRWDFTNSTARTFDNYTYNQGYATFGKGLVVGSLYHIGIMYSQGVDAGSAGRLACLSAILPFFSTYEVVDYPILMAQDNGAATTTTTVGQLVSTRVHIGKNRAAFTFTPTTQMIAESPAVNQYLPGAIDTFNTTCCSILPVYTYMERQFLGCVAGGMYQINYSASGAPGVGQAVSPFMTSDIDLSSNIACHYIRGTGGGTSAAWFALPVEEVKIGT